MATTIAVGVARPKAHGQAMMRTAIAFPSAIGTEGPNTIHTPNVNAAIPMTQGTKTPEILSASRCTGAFEP